MTICPVCKMPSDADPRDELDLHDLAHGHPVAERELASLRASLSAAAGLLKEARERLGAARAYVMRPGEASMDGELLTRIDAHLGAREPPTDSLAPRLDREPTRAPFAREESRAGEGELTPGEPRGASSAGTDLDAAARGLAEALDLMQDEWLNAGGGTNNGAYEASERALESYRAAKAAQGRG